MRTVWIVSLAFLVWTAFYCPPANATDELLGPIPYLWFEDSPFNPDDFGSFFFEDFEDHEMSLENISIDNQGGTISSEGWPPSAIDSVDGDDGNPNDGGCSECDSWWAFGPYGVYIIYEANDQGKLPTHAGVVWTDGAGPVTFSAFGADDSILGTIGPVDIADGGHNGTTGEDRFFGVICSSGVSKIHIRNSSGGIEIDHIQFGYDFCPNGTVFEDCRVVESSTILFGERYTRDASHFGPAGDPVFFDSTLVTITKNPGDQFFLSGQSTELASLICDDEVFIEADDSFVGVGLGPYEIYNTDFEPCRPISDFLRPVGALEITSLIPEGTNCIEFRLGDTQREIYGNTKIYLVGRNTSGVSLGGAPLSFVNYPNPFNPQTTIAFELPNEQAVSLSVYDVSGRLVDVLIDNEIAAQGRNEVVWRGRDMAGRVVSAGVYFYRLEAGSFSETKRMVLIK